MSTLQYNRYTVEQLSLDIQFNIQLKLFSTIHPRIIKNPLKIIWDNYGS